jgi:hypothetical protein
VVRTVGLEPTIPRSQSECPATGLRPGGAGAPGGGDGTRTRSRLHAKQLHHRCASPPGGPARGVCRARNLFGCPAAGQATWDRPVDAGPRSRPGSCAWHAALPRWRGLSTVERKERGSNPHAGRTRSPASNRVPPPFGWPFHRPVARAILLRLAAPYRCPDSNREPPGFEPDASASWATGAWCPRPDSNRDARVEHEHLKLARLPVPPRGQCGPEHRRAVRLLGPGAARRSRTGHLRRTRSVLCQVS